MEKPVVSENSPPASLLANMPPKHLPKNRKPLRKISENEPEDSFSFPITKQYEEKKKQPCRYQSITEPLRNPCKEYESEIISNLLKTEVLFNSLNRHTISLYLSMDV